MKEKAKNILSVLLRVGLSVALLIYLFGKINTQTMIQSLKSADFNYIYLAFIFFVLLHIIIFVRWFLFIRALQLSVPWTALVANFFVGLFFNLFLPTSTGGDLMKTLGVCRYTPHKARVVASVVLDRLCGFFAIVIVAFVTFVLGYNLIQDMTLLISIIVLAGISVLMMIVLFNERIYSFGCRIFNPFPRIKESLMSLHYDVVLLKDKKIVFVQTILLSCITQLCLSLTFFWVAKALHQQINFIYFLIFVPLICVVSSLPSLGGLGVRDVGAAHLFAKIGVSSGIAVSLTLLNFSFMMGLGLVGGIIYVFTLSPRRIQHHQGSAAASPKAA